METAEYLSERKMCRRKATEKNGTHCTHAMNILLKSYVFEIMKEAGVRTSLRNVGKRLPD
jgi:hypothetical protein